MIAWNVLSPLVAVVALSACASSQLRLKAGLERAGLREPVSSCMAERMSERLSMMQLRKVSSLANVVDDQDGTLTVSTDRFLHNVRALGDRDILAVASTSALVCTALR